MAVAIAIAFALRHASDVTGRGVRRRQWNANGVRDPGEAGIPGIAVSNQEHVVVTTDAIGRIPNGRRFERESASLSRRPTDIVPSVAFWRAAVDTGRSRLLALAKARQSGEFTFVHASDKHISPASVEAHAATARRCWSISIHPDLLLITGDPVARRSSACPRGRGDELLRPVRPCAKRRGHFKYAHVHGAGQPREFCGIERDTFRTWKRVASAVRSRHVSPLSRVPDYYLSFTRGGVHFVGLNTVDIDDQHYYGHVDSLQKLAWFRARPGARAGDDAGRHVRPHSLFLDVFEIVERVRSWIAAGANA